MRKYIDEVLRRFGYYRFEMPKGEHVSEADILEMMSAYGSNEQFTRFLRDLCAQDIRLYFQANSDRDRYTIRGAHDRCYYFLSLIKKSNERKTKSAKGGKQ